MTEIGRRQVLLGLAGTAAALAGCADDAADEPATSAAPSSTTAAGATSASTTSAAPAGPYVPPPSGEWELADLDASDWSTVGLRDLTDMVGASSSSTFIVLSGGRILAEAYWEGATATTTQDVASVQKSVTSTLVGIARDRGLLDLDDAVSDHVPAGWSRATPAEEARVTIRHVLTMSSGLDERTLRVTAEPGTTFEYNTEVYQKLRAVLEAAAGEDINAISRSWLFDAIGISDAAVWQERPVATPDAVGDVPWGLLLQARDMARFGLLAMRDGLWGDERVVPEGWFDEAWTASGPAHDYGYLWWLLGKGRRGGRDTPSDWVAALGARDQKIYVVPSMDLVVARQGDAARERSDAGSSWDNQLMQAILAAWAPS